MKGSFQQFFKSKIDDLANKYADTQTAEGSTRIVGVVSSCRSMKAQMAKANNTTQFKDDRWLMTITCLVNDFITGMGETTKTEPQYRSKSTDKKNVILKVNTKEKDNKKKDFLSRIGQTQPTTTQPPVTVQPQVITEPEVCEYFVNYPFSKVKCVDGEWSYTIPLNVIPEDFSTKGDYSKRMKIALNTNGRDFMEVWVKDGTIIEISAPMSNINKPYKVGSLIEIKNVFFKDSEKENSVPLETKKFFCNGTGISVIGNDIWYGSVVDKSPIDYIRKIFAKKPFTDPSEVVTRNDRYRAGCYVSALENIDNEVAKETTQQPTIQPIMGCKAKVPIVNKEKESDEKEDNIKVRICVSALFLQTIEHPNKKLETKSFYPYFTFFNDQTLSQHILGVTEPKILKQLLMDPSLLKNLRFEAIGYLDQKNKEIENGLTEDRCIPLIGSHLMVDNLDALKKCGIILSKNNADTFTKNNRACITNLQEDRGIFKFVYTYIKEKHAMNEWNSSKNNPIYILTLFNNITISDVPDTHDIILLPYGQKILVENYRLFAGSMEKGELFLKNKTMEGRFNDPNVFFLVYAVNHSLLTKPDREIIPSGQYFKCINNKCVWDEEMWKKYLRDEPIEDPSKKRKDPPTSEDGDPNAKKIKV